MIYLTVNDSPSGVFKSQVIDVVKELNSHSEENVRLIVLISFRNFLVNKKKIKSWNPDARVIRMIPGLKNWKLNSNLLRIIKGIKSECIIARGPLAFELASSFSKNVIYDGRGAVKAELEEFPDMIPDKRIVKSIIQAEKNAVLTAKYRIAVSSKLVEYWSLNYGYTKTDHLIIPCTLSGSIAIDKAKQEVLLHKYGWDKSSLVLIYSGSTAGWQSFKKVSKLIEEWIKSQNVNVLFLSQESKEIDYLQKHYGNKIQREWLDHSDVATSLSIGDYGILIRDENQTNFVASPVKFAEYLAAGLKVLISPCLGDFSQLVEQENVGVVILDKIVVLQKVTTGEKLRLSEFAVQNFTKKANSEKFKLLLSKAL